MNQFFYPRLALTNMKKHRKTYIPYLLSSIITVSMFYILTGLTYNKDIINKLSIGRSMTQILGFGVYIIVIFSCIFIFYTNSFLTKRRKKEIGLYNILGMEKRHIMYMLLFENIYTIIISIIGGLIFGVLFGKVLFLLLVKIVLKVNQDLQFPISAPAIRLTVLVFTPLFLATLLSNLWQIHFSNPITLLRGGKTGEKEPKTKWILTVIGIICLGWAYYTAQTIDEPLQSLQSFFFAVVLVIIGTYALFVSVTITVLKFLKRRKKFYYQTNHFTIVSGMIYRMKQNAVGLANICILSTCIIVMLASTFSLYFGVNDLIATDFPYKDFTYSPSNASEQEMDKAKQIIHKQLSKNHIQIQDATQYHSFRILAKQTANSFVTNNRYDSIKDIKNINILSVKEYNALHGSHITLQPNEVLWLNHPDALDKKTDFTINKEKFSIKEYTSSNKYAVGKEDYNIVVANEQVMDHINMLYTPDLDERSPNYTYAFNTNETTQDIIRITENIHDALRNNGVGEHVEHRVSMKQQYLVLYGGFLFIGIFLGIEFLLATALIIYYKQISEGYDDKEKYEIMQKVGMSNREIKKSIKFQVLSVFFLPILVAVIHYSFAFKNITSLLSLFRLNNVNLFLLCSIATVIIFLIFYSIVYFITSKIYYKIIK